MVIASFFDIHNRYTLLSLHRNPLHACLHSFIWAETVLRIIEVWLVKGRRVFFHWKQSPYLHHFRLRILDVKYVTPLAWHYEIKLSSHSSRKCYSSQIQTLSRYLCQLFSILLRHQQKDLSLFSFLIFILRTHPLIMKVHLQLQRSLS